MDKILLLTMLYDFYGELLTEKQKDIFELYHLNDYSLNEIGEEYDISRQAVLDSIKRTEKSLMQYEEKLSLVAKHIKQKQHITILKHNLEKIIIGNNFKEKDLSILEKMKSSLNLLLD